MMISRQFSNILARSMLAVLLIGGAALAQAQPIVGAVAFTGSTWEPVDADGSPTDLTSASGISIDDPFVFVETATGVFAGLQGTDLDLLATDLFFAPFQPLETALWSGGGFSFFLQDLELSFVNEIQAGLLGSGTLTGEGYDDTPALFSLTGDRAAGVSAFSGLTASLEVVDVPEPSIIGLLGVGVLALSLMGRRRRTV